MDSYGAPQESSAVQPERRLLVDSTTRADDRIQYPRPHIMPVLELMTSSGLGSLLGMRHALEPDHLAAVTTLVTGERNSIKAAFLGICWGLGHTFSLIVVGTILVVLRAEMPERIADGFEFCVALMLIGLGLRAMYLAARQGPAGPAHIHHHGATVHEHNGVPAHIHIGTWTLARRPLIVGAVHGLAGSGALTALVVATLPTAAARITYMLLFGLGSTLGMAALSGLLGWPLARAGRHRGLARALSLAVGGVSTVLGFAWGYPIVSRIFG
jgi:High-affinity nickel-transport protein